MSDVTEPLGQRALPGLPAPPPTGAAALPAGTFDGVDVFVTGAGTGLGKAIATEFARLGAGIVIASRKPEHLEAGAAAMAEVGARCLTVACDIREPDQIAAAFDAAAARASRPLCSSTTRPRTFRCRPKTCRRTRGGPWSTSR